MDFGKRLRSPGIQAITASLFISLASLLNISLYTNDFKISVAIILMPVFAFLIQGLPVALTGVLSAVGVFLLRAAVYGVVNGHMAGAVSAHWPEMVFYAFYGLLLALYSNRVSLRPYRFFAVLPLALADFGANVLELSIRIGSGIFSFRVLAQLAAIALFRTLAAAFIMWAFDYYGVAVLRHDDTLRYQRLLIMTSMLESELFWMRKSSALIEDAMSTAYELHQNLRETPGMDAYAATAMDIAKDIHEVKKEYALIVRGIADTLKTGAAEDGMYYADICGILQNSLFRGGGHSMRFSVAYSDNFYTREHYPLMSSLNNLLSNAIEAADGRSAHVSLRQESRENRFIFTVQDDCGGIDPRYINKIFLPGFSSKSNGKTGEMGRGLGLCVIREIVEEKLGGVITVESAGGKTAFYLDIPRDALEVKA